jgi:NADPH:quinone reductase-like Zn-dependent oxidoreductase/thioesterase domain-containing protein/acyl carrier protein
MTSIAPSLKSSLEKIIRVPKQRSSKWISTSIPEQRWDSDLARYSSPDYHVNNLCSPVLFQEALKCIPANAITIEIAPHALLQAILKRSLSAQTAFIPLMKKDATNQVEFVLTQLGRLYVEGANIDTTKLFIPAAFERKVYPVPYNTRFLSPLVKWDHSQQWNIPKYEDFILGAKGADSFANNTFKYTVDAANVAEDAYLAGHQIDGRVLYPATGYLYLVWKSLAKMNNFTQVEQLPVAFENVEIHRATILNVKDQQAGKKIIFTVTIMPTNGLFELTEGGNVVVTGRVYVPETPFDLQTPDMQTSLSSRQRTDLMEQEEIYKELRLRGYEYNGEFQPIIKADIDGTRGELLWNAKWIPFLDAMLQMNVLGQRRGLLLPTRIRSIRIDPMLHTEYQKYARFDEMNPSKFMSRFIKSSFTDEKPAPWYVIPVVFDPFTNTTVSGGVEIVGLHATSAPRRQFYQPTILERVNFVPYVERQLDDEYVFVDKLAGAKADDIDAIHVDPDFGAHETTIRQYREFYEYYLNELKRCAVQIMRKIEFPMGAYGIISPTPFPFKIQKQFEELSIRMPTIKSKYQATPATPFAELIEGGKLLKFLSTLANLDSTDSQYFYSVQKAFSDKFAYYLALEEDRVLNYFNKRSYYLKNMLDTVLENTQFGDYKQPTLKVLEISPSFSHFFGGKVNSFIKTHPHVSAVDYQYMPVFGSEYSMPEGLEFLSYFNKQFANPIEKVEWNMGLRSGKLTAEPPRHLKDFDLVIFNGSLNTLLPYVDSEFNLQTWLHTIVDKVMKPQGFMLVHEYVNNFDALTQLNQLEQVVFRQQQPSQMIYPIQTFQNESQWRQCIEDAGFYPVALKSDGILSTMSLYRRPYNTTIKPSTLYEEKILIDDLDQFSWIEKLKLALADKQLERVWLVSEKSPNSGIVGLVNCLRKEFGGDKIRCVFITDKYPIMHTSYLLPVVQEKLSQPGVAQWTQLFDQIRKTDLVMNVFRNGKWGSYRHIFEGSNVDSIVIDNEKAFYEAMKYDTQAKFGNAYINLLSRGDLSTLKWMQSPEPFINDVTRQLACQVSYAALNFRDIMLATGKLTPEAIPNYYKMQDSLLGMEFCGYDKNNRQKRYMGMVPAKGLATTVVVDPKYVWEVPRDWTLEQAATVPVAYSTAYYALIVRGNLRKGERVLIHAGSGAVGQAAIAIALSYGCKVFVTVSSDEKREYLKAVFPGQLTDDSFANSRDIQFEKQIMKATQGRGVDVVLNSLAEDKLQASIRVLAQHGRFLEIGKFDLNKNSQLGLSVFLKNIAFHGILLDSLFDVDNAEWKQVYQLVEEGIRTGVVRPLKATVFNVDQIEEAFRFMAQGKHIGKVLVKVWDPKETNEQPIQITGLPKVWFSPMQTYIITGGLGGFGLELAQWMVERGARRLILTSRSGVRTGYQTRKLRTLLEEFNAQVQVVPFDVKDEAECISLIKEAQKMSFDKKIGGIFHLAAVLEDGMFENQTAERFRRVSDVKYQGALNLDKFTRIEGVMDDSAYFVVFSSVTSGRGNFGQTNYGFANSGMERICEFRRRDGKHALAIQWGAIGDVGLIVESTFGGDNDTVVGGTVPQRISSCLKTLEHLLLKSTEPRDSAIWSTFVPAERMSSAGGFKSTPSQQQKSLVEMVANVLGLKDVKQWRNEQMTLGEMGLDSLMSVEIKQILEQCFNLPLSTKEIQQLTMEKLKLIEQSKASPVAESLKIVDVPTTIINSKVHYLMPTRVIEKLNQIEFTSPQQIPVFVIHPIEGHVNMLKSWAKHMKYPVYGVQYTQEAMQFETIEQLADFYFQNIDKELAKYTTVVQPRIHLCGYSFGASVAFEMAGRRTNRIASLTLLDGSHSYVTAHVNMYKSKFQLDNTIETEAEALFSFVQQYTQVLSRRDFIEDLLKLATFEQRVKYAVRELMKKSQFQFEAIDLEQAARSYVAKLFMSHKYQPKQMVRLNEILLIKSGQRSNLVQTLGEDYGLSTVFNGKIDVQVVDGDHRSFLDANNGFQVASIMNEYLLRCF